MRRRAATTTAAPLLALGLLLSAGACGGEDPAEDGPIEQDDGSTGSSADVSTGDGTDASTTSIDEGAGEGAGGAGGSGGSPDTGIDDPDGEG